MNITGLIVIGALIVLLVSAAYMLLLPRRHGHGAASRGDRPDRHPDPTIGFRDLYR